MYSHKNGISLIKIEEQDLLKLKKLKDESWFGTHNIAIVNMADQEKWFRSLDSRKDIILKAFLTDSGEEVGLYKISDIDWMNRKYSSAHDIFEDQRSKGFSKKVLEAGVDFGFEVLNMNRIETEVLENNIASLKSAIWVGYLREGTKRKCIHKCGEYLDSIFLGILREDWNSLERVKSYGGVCNVSYKPKNGE
jgi:RimJ/RimL family protein N-acetyltransferase